MLDKVIIAMLVSLMFSAVTLPMQLIKLAREKKYQEMVEKYKDVDVENLDEEIQSHCAYINVTAGDDEILKKYLYGLINKKEITYEQGAKFFYQYLKNKKNHF